MNKVTLLRGTYVEKGSSISNPLYLPNRRHTQYTSRKLDDSYGLPFYVLLSEKGKELDLKRCQRLAEDRAWESAFPKEVTNEVVVQFEINELTFPIFSNKIRHPYKSGSTSVFLSSFQELLDLHPTQLHIITKDLTLQDLRSIPIKIGRKNLLGRFSYKDFVAPNEGVEGNIKHPSERK